MSPLRFFCYFLAAIGVAIALKFAYISGYVKGVSESNARTAAILHPNLAVTQK